MDVLVNNAGVCITHDLQSPSLDYESFQQAVRQTIDVNFMGAANLSFLCTRVFETQPAGGRIINITSRAAKRGELTAPAYAASKAALNQLVKTASIELSRRNKDSICVSLHPGTVATALSEPFAKTGLNVRPASEAAADLLAVLAGLNPADTGCLIDYQGQKLPF